MAKKDTESIELKDKYSMNEYTFRNNKELSTDNVGFTTNPINTLSNNITMSHCKTLDGLNSDSANVFGLSQACMAKSDSSEERKHILEKSVEIKKDDNRTRVEINESNNSLYKFTIAAAVLGFFASVVMYKSKKN